MWFISLRIYAYIGFVRYSLQQPASSMPSSGFTGSWSRMTIVENGIRPPTLFGKLGDSLDETAVVQAWCEQDAFSSEETGLSLLHKLYSPTFKCTAHARTIDQRNMRRDVNQPVRVFLPNAFAAGFQDQRQTVQCNNFSSILSVCLFN